MSREKITKTEKTAEKPAETPKQKSLSEAKKRLQEIGAKPAEKLKEESPYPPDITKERLIAAKKYIASALKTLNAEPYKTLLENKKIELKPEHYYLAIVVKESRGKAKAVSETGAVGYFQLTKIAVEEVNEVFKTKLKFKEVKENSWNNTVAGILYWHFCKDIAPAKYKAAFTDGKNADLSAGFRYNAGPGITRDLYNALGSPQTYPDFEKLLAQKLAGAFPNDIKLTGGKMFERQGYKVKFYSEIQVVGSIKDKKISIGGKTLDVEKIVEAMRYGRIIRAIRRDEKYRL